MAAKNKVAVIQKQLETHPSIDVSPIFGLDRTTAALHPAGARHVDISVNAGRMTRNLLQNIPHNSTQVECGTYSSDAGLDDNSDSSNIEVANGFDSSFPHSSNTVIEDPTFREPVKNAALNSKVDGHGQANLASREQELSSRTPDDFPSTQLTGSKLLLLQKAFHDATTTIKNLEREKRTLQKEKLSLQSENRALQMGNQYQALRTEKQNFQKEIKNLQKENQTLKSENRTLREEKGATQTEKQNFQRKNQTLLIEKQTLQIENQQLSALIAVIRKDFSVLNGKLTASKIPTSSKEWKL